MAIALVLGIYVGVYFVFSQRSYDLWGGYTISYPGAVRFYALSTRTAESLGASDELWEKVRRSGEVVSLNSDSVYTSRRGIGSYFWRIFYPIERVHLIFQGVHPEPIVYSAPRVGATSKASSSTLPLAGLVYHESFARGDMLYRLVGAVHSGRNDSNDLLMASDVYLFEWRIAGHWGGAPRIANRVRRVDINKDLKWPYHWLLDADHYLTWDENRKVATELIFQSEKEPARTSATLDNIGPVRCNADGPITVNRSATLIVGERDGLRIFDARTLEPVHELMNTSALKHFFEARPDELNKNNSACFLTDDGKQLIRVVTIYRADMSGGTVVVAYDIDKDAVREIPVDVGIRADVKDVESLGGVLWFYVITTNGDRKWTQQLRDETGKNVLPLSPAQLPDTQVMEWDVAHSRLVQLPGFEANPQSLDMDSDIQLQLVPSLDIKRGVIRYGDSVGNPPLFRPGKIIFSQ